MNITRSKLAPAGMRAHYVERSGMFRKLRGDPYHPETPSAGDWWLATFEFDTIEEMDAVSDQALLDLFNTTMKDTTP